MIIRYDHVQIAMPRGGEAMARSFYAALLGMHEQPKPPPLAARGGCWFTSGSADLHLGVDDPFHPALKAHPAFVVDDLDALVVALRSAGYDVRDDNGRVGIRRVHTDDPFGNRLEFQQR